MTAQSTLDQWASIGDRVDELRDLFHSSRSVSRFAKTADASARMATGRATARELAKVQDYVRDISRPAVASCGRTVCTRRYNGGVAIQKRGGEGAHFQGVATCGSAHECLHCSSQQRSERRELLEALGRKVARDYPDGAVAMLTLTVRHTLEDDAKRLVCGLYRAASRLRKQCVWGQFRRLGGIYVQAFEITYSYRAGWHPHFHIMLVSPTGRMPETWDEMVSEEWRSCVESELSPEHVPSAEHGVRADWTSTSDAGEMSKYITKLAAELTDSTHAKKGRKSGSRTPWQIASDYARASGAVYAIGKDIERADEAGDAAELHELGGRLARVQGIASANADLWRTYCEATRRKRINTGPKALAMAREALEEEQRAEEGAEAVEVERVAVIPQEVWGALRMYKQTRVHLLEAADAGGLVAVLDCVRALPAFRVEGRLQFVPGAEGVMVVQRGELGALYFDPAAAAAAIRRASAEDWPELGDEPDDDPGDRSEFVDE